MSPRELVELDEDEFLAFHQAVVDRQETTSWSNTEELLATVVDSINALRAEIRSGIAVLQVRKLAEPDQPERYPRPDFVDVEDYDDSDVIVMRPRDLARKMMNRKGA